MKTNGCMLLTVYYQVIYKESHIQNDHWSNIRVANHDSVEYQAHRISHPEKENQKSRSSQKFGRNNRIKRNKKRRPSKRFGRTIRLKRTKRLREPSSMGKSRRPRVPFDWNDPQ